MSAEVPEPPARRLKQTMIEFIEFLIGEFNEQIIASESTPNTEMLQIKHLDRFSTIIGYMNKEELMREFVNRTNGHWWRAATRDVGHYTEELGPNKEPRWVVSLQGNEHERKVRPYLTELFKLLEDEGFSKSFWAYIFSLLGSAVDWVNEKDYPISEKIDLESIDEKLKEFFADDS